MLRLATQAASLDALGGAERCVFSTSTNVFVQGREEETVNFGVGGFIAPIRDDSIVFAMMER
jgi:hypothetical protein